MGQVVSTINVLSQVGQEASVGSGGAAGTRLQALKIEPADELTIKEIEAQGHRFSTGTVQDMAWSSFAVSASDLLYTEQLYCLENLFGTVTPTALGTKTQKRVYDMPLTGSVTPKTWTQQFGDPGDDVKQYGYGLLTDYDEKYDRESGVVPGGAGIAQLISSGNTFTATPKTLAEIPVAANQINYYLDTTGAALGTTQLFDELNTVEWSLKGIKAARWASDRAQASFKSHVDLKPKTDVKMNFHEGPVTRAIIASLKQGQTYFLRIDAQGPYIENFFAVGVGAASAGTFTLTYKTQTTSAIAFNATAATVQAALVALTSIGAGNVTVTGTAPTWTVTMAGSLANDGTTMTGTGTGLTGGAFSITGTQLPYMSRRDMALRFVKPASWKDTKGIYAREASFVIVEDATWQHALMCTSQTAEASSNLCQSVFAS
jgi:hypothetical protein